MKISNPLKPNTKKKGLADLGNHKSRETEKKGGREREEEKKERERGKKEGEKKGRRRRRKKRKGGRGRGKKKKPKIRGQMSSSRSTQNPRWRPTKHGETPHAKQTNARQALYT